MANTSKGTQYPGDNLDIFQSLSELFLGFIYNLFLRSQPSEHTKLVYETPLFVGQGTPLHPTI
jgi:hypothetical protein